MRELSTPNALYVGAGETPTSREVHLSAGQDLNDLVGIREVGEHHISSE